MIRLFFIGLVLFFSAIVCAEEEHSDTDVKDVKNEKLILCPNPLSFKDGYYVAVAAGYDVYKMVDHVTYHNTDVLYSADPPLSVNGMMGDFMLGYTKLFGKNSNFSIGVEFFANGSAADNGFEITLPAFPVIIDSDITVNGSFGLGILPGFKINNASIIYLKMGYSWSTISMDQTVRAPDDEFGISSIEYNDNITTHGFLYGVGLEAAFNEQFNLRAEYTYTGYQSFNTGSAAKVDPSRNQYLFGLVYHFSPTK